MSVSNPAFLITRRTVAGNENEFVKIFDPPTASPATPELLNPTNPVPEFMALRERLPVDRGDNCAYRGKDFVR